MDHAQLDARQIDGAISPGILEQLKQIYDTSGPYRSSTMNKADPDRALPVVEPILREHFPFMGKFLGGNFYKHSLPYHPHVDHELTWPLAVNFVIPITIENTDTDFIVFDQRWHMSPRTWSLVQDINKFRQNDFTTTIPTSGIPGLSEIEGSTKQPVDEQFWKEHLHHARENYFGLSGKAFSFKPGSVIMFETKHIHCTGRFFNGTKLGLTIRYAVEG